MPIKFFHSDAWWTLGPLLPRMKPLKPTLRPATANGGAIPGVARTLAWTTGILVLGWTAAAAQGSSPAPGDSAAPATVAAAIPSPLAPASDDSAASPVPVPQATARPKFALYTISDEGLLRELWRQAGREGDPEPGKYQALIFAPPESRVLLLRDGTQSGTLDSATQAWLRDKIRSQAAQSGDGTTRTLGSGFWGNFWNPSDWLGPYRWPTGIEAAARVDLAAFKNTTPLLGEHYDLTLAQQPLWWLTTEAGAHVSRYGGGPYRNLYNPADNRPDWNAWSEYAPWWSAAVGFPGVKWEMTLSNREFPRYFWLDPNAGEGSFLLGVTRAGLPVDTTEFAQGNVMKRWNARGANPRPSNNNIAHTIHLKAGNFRYMAHFDDDIYRAMIQQFMFEEIRAPFGQWAIGFISTKGASHSRLRLDLFEWNGLTGPAAADIRTRIHFLRVNLDYRDASTFRLGLSTTVNFDAPTLRPGESP